MNSMVTELWPFFYRHVQQKFYWARLAINCWHACNVITQPQLALAGKKIAYFEIPISQASGLYRVAKHCYFTSGRVLRNRQLHDAIRHLIF